MRLIGSGPPEAVSFNDVGSPDGRLTSGLKVHINAQVLRGEDLAWYYSMLQLCPDIPDELKSSVVTSRFESLPLEMRTRIWRTLSRVAMHIVDPRPYKNRMDESLRSALRMPDAPQRVRASASEGNEWARQLQELTQRFTADAILRDSVASRANRMARIFGPETIHFMGEAVCPPLEMVGVDDFRCAPKGLVRKVAEWSAKAAAAFQGSMDSVERHGPEFYALRFPAPRFIRSKMVEPLLDAHAFDEGDEQQMRVLEEVRGRLIDSFTEGDPYMDFYASTPRGMYCEVDSSESLFGQAADIAAGIAATLFERGGIAAIVAKFEYVTHNGRRSGVSEAEEIMRENKDVRS